MRAQYDLLVLILRVTHIRDLGDGFTMVAQSTRIVKALLLNIEIYQARLGEAMPPGEGFRPPDRKGTMVGAPLNYLKRNEQSELRLASVSSVGKPTILAGTVPIKTP